MIKDQPKATELSLLIMLLVHNKRCIIAKIIIKNKISINIIMGAFRLYIIKYNSLILLNLSLMVSKFFI